MSDLLKEIMKGNICVTMNLIYTLSGVIKTCTQLDDNNDTVKQTALEVGRTITLLSADLFDHINQIYGDTAE